ncbi:AraC family transcriptional regulator [Microbacterium sp.]|uniref:AraC family transcriptional regulator n=1 Tax=Microbacterium sp. TaxID=51671 RepID=UPI0025E2AF0B|nr:AraC family transcriptional regulator [Microbacterium sp.]
MDARTGEMFSAARVVSCRDVDDARAALGDVFLPVDFPSATRSGIVDMQLNALAVGRITCGFMRFGEAVRIHTAEATNYHIDIPVRGRARMRAARGPLVQGTKDKAGIFMPGRPVEIDCEEEFAQISLMVPRDQLQLETENLVGIALTRPLEFSAEVDLTTSGGRTMMQALWMIDEASGQSNGILAHPLAAQRLEQVLLHALLLAQPHNYSAALAGRTPVAGVRPVAQAVDLLRSSPDHPWTVTELAAAVSMSPRALQEGFRRALDTTPMSYLRSLRLERVHEELASAEPGTRSVTEVAARWGFAHLGRFAAAYRAAFAEQPSVTLRSTRTR